MLIGIDASRAFFPYRTGTENYTWQLLLALAKLECKHTFRIYAKGNLKSQISNLKQIQNSNGRNSKQFDFKIINWPYFWTQGGLALETWRHPVGVLFIPAHVIPFLKNPKVPAVVAVHDLGFEFLPWHQNPIQRFYLSKIIEKLRSQLATHIIAVSQATKKDLVGKLGVPEEKITVVYEGVDRGKFKVQSSKFKVEEIKKKYKIEGDYILFVGTVQPRKNLVRLIKAFSQIIRDNSRSNSYKFVNLQLVIVGKRGWSADEIYQTPGQLGIADKVKFLDYVSDNDLPALYAGAACFCLPSLKEGFGLPVLEAMACGTPVVISNTSSLPEVGGDAAIYVNPYDVDSIADGLGQVLSIDKVGYKCLVEKGLKQAQKFSWEECAKETVGVFEEVVNRNP